ncbi:MAG: pyruvate:ferredoxin (flavodoxin) oxidoreductase [Verrucomicrobia bacterium 61-8]|nr:pyruvate:ferredoxin (flavodoxin) oxidoreductase [Verrucomicrobiota bacterium]OJV17451.1 MAG: pyruvate:ferredoxin (flavodoxin) oxidoreductase [Verrucomicrobia bacterium 61-8]
MKAPVTLDANEAVASVAYRLSETIAIYPITPSSPMAEWCDEWSSKSQPNLWNIIPQLVQMQSEAGVAGAIHGMLQAGSLSTTFTASQGLLLMIPNLYKIAGELLPFVLHVTARTVAAHALSIFGDHSDVMACRQTGVAMLCSNSVQEAQDLALIAHAATLAGKVPFIHFFDGFRTSHEIGKIDELGDDVLRRMIDDEWIAAFRDHGLSPDHPVIRGTAQNPDVFFQARESCNPYYNRLPGVVQALMDRFADLTGREYGLFQYTGHPHADRVIIAMGSGAETAEETALALNQDGERTGVLKIRLFRPFSVPDFLGALPRTVRSIAVLDRTKEPGAIGEPLYQDVITAIAEGRAAGCSPFEVEPVVIGGRYGLSSKEFTPAMVKAVYDELKAERPRRHFTVGINDDITGTSLDYDREFDIEPDDVCRAVFFGLGSDGTVGANKNSIKIIGEKTANYAQGYFVYDSKKSGAMTVSHLRFGPRPIGSHYLIGQANFVGVHQFPFFERFDVLGIAAEGATVLINTPFPPSETWSRLPRLAQEQILEKHLRVYAIDAVKVAAEAGLGNRINTIMQTCFFALSGVIPKDEAIAHIKEAIEHTYSKKGAAIVEKNYAGVDRALAGMVPVEIPANAPLNAPAHSLVPQIAPEFVQHVTAPMMAGLGDELPVSAFPPDGTWPTGTAKWEKRNVGLAVPIWNSDICIQCNKCALVCPHACIRPKYYPSSLLETAPDSFQSADFRSRDFKDYKYTLQVAPEDCTGCTLCVQVCPVKDKADPKRKALNMAPHADHVEAGRKNFDFFLTLPNADRSQLKPEVKSSQFAEPLFEFSGACAGCGETPYIKLLTQLYGDRAVIANATGCSSIYGGNLPTTPYTTNSEGRGPAWSNSLFEDNAEYGLGLRFAYEQQNHAARQLLSSLAPQIGDDFVNEILTAPTAGEAAIAAQRERISVLRDKLPRIASPVARRLEFLADSLVPRSVWIIGGDGWAYDIGFGGLDHVMSLGLNINILVLDTEVYSNTGGQQSKATPLGALAKFASNGKNTPKKDLGMIAMSYGSVYVARVAFGAKDSQTLKAFEEAESYPGTSLILAYSHCIAHGYSMNMGLEQQKLAVNTGTWPLYRFDPRRAEAGQPSFQLDCGSPTVPVAEYLKNELRFRSKGTDKARAAAILAAAQADVDRHWDTLQAMAQHPSKPAPSAPAPAAAAPAPKPEAAVEAPSAPAAAPSGTPAKPSETAPLQTAGS